MAEGKENEAGFIFSEPGLRRNRDHDTAILVYDLRTQNLSFVAPIPEQTGTTTMHFPEVSGGTY